MFRVIHRPLALLVAGATIVALLGCSLSANILREQVQPTPTVEAQPTPQEPDQPAPVRVVTATPEPLTEQEAYDAAEASTIRVYERVSPAVVHIKSQVTTMDFFGAFTPPRAQARASSSTKRAISSPTTTSLRERKMSRSRSSIRR